MDMILAGLLPRHAPNHQSMPSLVHVVPCHIGLAGQRPFVDVYLVIPSILKDPEGFERVALVVHSKPGIRTGVCAPSRANTRHMRAYSYVPGQREDVTRPNPSSSTARSSFSREAEARRVSACQCDTQPERRCRRRACRRGTGQRSPWQCMTQTE